ncbi:hypothetical protein FJ414_27705 [Mesorhizobium sp. B3-1-6]|uniref:HD domain-containing protein n=1 Tax=Mesorhizobium sp. B3-1-6 TaxID=2589895 RepID=UPI00112E2BFE|nr:ATP-binding protein [Mesorhizobium sp. B3-1-6]TPI28194.1 hypothetical protein FJ414_27705 [Mesorhizobium sp. B3-1-6]
MSITIETVEKIIPDEIFSLFKSDAQYAPSAITAANRFSEWFKVSGIPFFKNYTDHSERHSLEVFSSAMEFISRDSFPVVSAEDISVLLCSCFCHDCGMHLTEKQFLKLVNENHIKIYNKIDKITWPSLWKNFVQEAKRFNQDTLISIFGDIEPIPNLPSNILDFTDRQRLLVGEFLRRNHPQLAHDIALGLSEYLSLPQMLPGFDNRIRDLIGYIARSHGMDLRTTFPYIGSEFDIRDFNRIHIVYLMGLIRLADYAQIQATRAPTLRTIHPIKSPISQREWRVHQSVINITRTHDDPDAILIDSRPSNVSDFLRVKGWLTDLQSEMDKTWAVLGEVYGRQEASRLDRLHLSVRRIRSNVLENFASPDFVPDSISFKVAETEMLSLLLSPLYGDHPGYGVRELLQNARDAVIEAKALDTPHLKKEIGKIDVFLNVNESTASFRIVDNGVGMDIDILKNYFLNAGASYRTSKSWQATYVDDDGHSTIARSGRFGVGALAAFLIGPKISVKTRRWNANDAMGHEFSAGLHDKEIEIKPAKRDIGCEIEIETDSHRAGKLYAYLKDHKHYYSFDKSSPRVDIHLSEDGDEEIIHVDENNSDPINTFNTNKFKNVRWGLSNERVDRPDFVNGIAVRQISDSGPYSSIDSLYGLGELFNSLSFDKDRAYYGDSSIKRRKKFWLTLEDPDAFAPLNLSRTQFSSFDQEITDHIDDFLFESFARSVDTFHSEIKSMKKFVIGEEHSPYIYFDRGAFLFRGPDIIPYDYDIVRSTGIRTIMNVGKTYDGSQNINQRFEDQWFSCRGIPPSSPSTLSHNFRAMRDLVQFGEYDYIVGVMPIELAESLKSLVRPTRWMVDLVDRSDEIERFGKRHAIVEIGERVDSVYNKTLLASEEIRSDLLDVYYSESSDFSFEAYREKVEIRGCFADRWANFFPSPSA